MEGEKFHVFVSSRPNAYFPRNTNSSFSCKLPDKLDLKSNYEVGIDEAFIPNDLYNVEEDGDRFTYLNTTLFPDGRGSFSFSIPPGLYDPYTYALVLNQIIKRVKESVGVERARHIGLFLAYRGSKKRFYFHASKGDLLLVQSKNAMKNLGIDDRYSAFPVKHSGHMPLPSYLLQTPVALVQSNIVKPAHFFNDEQRSLLGVFQFELFKPHTSLENRTISSQINSTTTTITHKHGHTYHPVQAGSYSWIEIKLTHPDGRAFKFRSDASPGLETWIVLHFRPRKN